MEKIIASSKNPEELSMTVNGVLMAIVPIMIALFKALDIPVLESELVDIVQQVTALIAGLVMLVGMLRKLYMQIKKGI